MIPLNILKAVLVTLLIATGLFGGCEQPSQPPLPEEELYFQPGEYGGDPLEGTEHLYNLQLSPDGTKMALIRSHTPEDPFAPHDQLWVVNADGTEPELIGYNIGTVDWSPDGRILTITFVIGFHDTYIITFNLQKRENIRIWSGIEDVFLYEQTASNPRWFNTNDQLLVSVWGKAYKQSYKRGIYIINTNDQVVEGPLVEIAGGGLLGNNGEYFISNKYLTQSEPFSGNYIRYDFDTKTWEWITQFPSDSLNRWVKQPVPNPKGIELIFSRHLNNAWQLFQMNEKGKEVRQITELGGSQPRWSPDGRYVYFNRDMHKAPGARYIPHSYELATGEIEVLWPDLPDSVPQFPPLDTQQPIDFYSIVQSNAPSKQ